MISIDKKQKFFYIILVFIILIVYSFLLPLDIMDIDSTQYAEITREIIENHNYFQLRDNGRKYLDKPIMTFWILSLSFSIFGVNNFAYRFPALVFGIFSLIAIYKISWILYKNEKKSWLSVLLYSISPCLFTMLINPIIDIYLTSFVLFVFLFYFYGKYKDNKYFYFMYFFIGIGFITKGPISLILPVISIGGNIILTRNWKLLKKLKLLQGFIIVFIPVFFWSYLLYKEFGIYGPYFFLYLQSFGRFFSKIYDTGWNPFYFYYTYLFSILPVAIPLLFILYDKFKKYNITNKLLDKKYYKDFFNTTQNKDYTIYIWSFFVLILLSFSKFRLPQYVFWLIPGSIIIISNWIIDYIENNNKKIINSFYFIPFLILIFLLFLPFYTGVEFSIIFYFVLFFVLVFLYFFYEYQFFISFMVISFLLLYAYIIGSLYPLLMQYQPASKIASRIQQIEKQNGFTENFLYTYGIPFSHRSYAFYSKRITKPIELKKYNFLLELEKNKNKLIIVEEKFYKPLEVELYKNFNTNLNIEIMGKYPYYKVSKPSIHFFNKNKREKLTKYVYLLWIKIKNF